MVTMSATLTLLPLASGAVILRFSGNFLLMSGSRHILTLGLSAVPYKFPLPFLEDLGFQKGAQLPLGHGLDNLKAI